MVNEDNTQKLFEMIKKLSETETNEIELMIAIFKKMIIEEINKKIAVLVTEFNDACNSYNKNPEQMDSVKDEIIGAYEKNFYKIKERIEEQYVNLIFELQEAELNQKIAIAKYNNNVNNETNNLNHIETIIDKYGNYCGLEEECYRMLDECTVSIPYLINTVMKFEDRNLPAECPKGFISKIKFYIKTLFNSKKFEKMYVEPKKIKIAQIVENTNEVVEEIRVNTANYIDTLELYKEQIKEAANANIIA